VDAAVLKVAVESKSVTPPSLWEDLGQEVGQNVVSEILRIELFLISHKMNNVKAINTSHHCEHKL
jgi:hypothetical protein